MLQNRQLLGILLVHLFDPNLFILCVMVHVSIKESGIYEGEIRGIKGKAHTRDIYTRILTQHIYTAIDIKTYIN